MFEENVSSSPNFLDVSLEDEHDWDGDYGAGQFASLHCLVAEVSRAEAVLRHVTPEFGAVSHLETSLLVNGLLDGCDCVPFGLVGVVGLVRVVLLGAAAGRYRMRT